MIYTLSEVLPIFIAPYSPSRKFELIWRQIQKNLWLEIQTYFWKICLKFSLRNTANRETSPAMERFDIVIPGRQRPDVNGNTVAPSKTEAKVPSPTSTNYLKSEPLFKKTIAAFTTCLSTTACTGDKLDPPKLADEVPLLLNSFFSSFSSFSFFLFFSSFLFFS